MKNNLLVLRIHSTIDVITNSSTELFVCDKEKSLDAVKKLIEEKWELAKPLYDFSGSVWDVLEVKQITKKDVEQAEKERNENEYGFWLDSYAYNEKFSYNAGDIHIVGTSDNSIPYEFFDVIEKFFQCQRFHLG